MVGLIAAGVVVSLAWLLAGAGASKLLRPGPGVRSLGPGTARPGLVTRALGAAELALAMVGIVAPARPAAAFLAATFAGFAVAHVRGARTGEAGCGCFGARAAASPRRAVALTAASALLAAATAASASARGPALGVLAARPLAGALVAAASGAAALTWWLAFTGTGLRLGAAGNALIDSSARFLEERVSRRTALVRLAVAGSALTVAPLRYLLYPGTALAAILPGDCAGGLCTDGYTAFCCEINRGANVCPEGTFVGGWWMCTDYPGRRLCAEQGIRYYIDCNRIPGTSFPGGCQCAGNSCANRRVACNVFRYGQCNTQVRGVTEVVCRMVVCENPSQIPGLHCSDSLAVDDAVCAQDVPCLEPRAVELAGAGGV